MSLQFGTNWPGFMAKAGNVTGPLLGYEVLTTFFLEASFLTVMLFGKNKVSNKMHIIAFLVVALGTTVSTFWVLSLNAWLQTPEGYTIIDGVIHIESGLEFIFNPSFPYRFTQMLIASLLMAAFLIVGISASRLRSRVSCPATGKLVKTGVFLAAAHPSTNGSDYPRRLGVCGVTPSFNVRFFFSVIAIPTVLIYRILSGKTNMLSYQYE